MISLFPGERGCRTALQAISGVVLQEYSGDGCDVVGRLIVIGSSPIISARPVINTGLHYRYSFGLKLSFWPNLGIQSLTL